MNFSFKRFPATALLLALAASVATADFALADCARGAHVRDTTLPSQGEPGAEAAVSMADPALDGMFTRYADLHRDALGYAVTDLIGSSMVAKAAPATPVPITR
jgi:hypothetical protein